MESNVLGLVIYVAFSFLCEKFCKVLQPISVSGRSVIDSCWPFRMLSAEWIQCCANFERKTENVVTNSEEDQSII
jgi:hypothetical protein